MTLPFTPTSGSWLNLVEAFFPILTRQALRRGDFPTVADLIAAIQRFLDAWNDRCAPFTWTKDPDTIRQGRQPTASQDTADVRCGPLGRFAEPIVSAVVSQFRLRWCFQPSVAGHP